MRHFLFEDYDTGEQFIVTAYSYADALADANLYFGDPSYICELDDFEAEASGLDEY